MDAVEVLTIDDRVTNLDTDTLDELHSSLLGRVITPDADDFDDVREIWNGMIDQRPALIARCTGTADVMRAVDFASERDLRLAVRGGGHNVSGGATGDKAMMLDLSAMNSVRVDPDQRTAQVAGGALLRDVDHETQAFGLAAPLGVVSETGVAGLTLHGGVGWQTRKRGLALDNLRSVEIVTADGELRRASEDENSELFWGVRGAGSNFGVVTSFEFDLYPVGPEVWLLTTMFPAEVGPEALEFFDDYMQQAPEELGAIALYWTAPDEPEVAEEARGEPVIVFLGCYTGSVEEGESVLAPLRDFATPVVDYSEPMKFSEVQQFLDEDYPDGMLYYWKSLYLPELDDEIIDTITRYAATRPSDLSSLDIWALDGAATRVSPEATAFASRKAPYLFGIEANWTDPADSDANLEWAREVFDAVQELTDEPAYLNFPGFEEDSDDPLRAAYGPNYDRLQQLKATYDPDNLFVGSPNIEPG